MGQKERYDKWLKAHPARRILKQAKDRAKVRGLELDIGEEDIKIPEVCPVLGIPLVQHWGDGSGYFPDSPSIDRIDNNKGYVKGNIAVISNKANMIKRNATVEELRLIYEYARNL